jgi:hypothetical protein
MHRGAGPHSGHDRQVHVEMVLVEDLLSEFGVLGLFPWADDFDRNQGIVEDESVEQMSFLLLAGAL